MIEVAQTSVTDATPQPPVEREAVDSVSTLPLPRLQGKGVAFRLSVRWLVPYGIGIALSQSLLFGLTVVAALGSGSEQFLTYALGSLPFFGGMTTMMTLLYRHFCTVYIGPDGISSVSYLTTPMSVRWSEIARVAPVRHRFLPSLRVNTHTGRLSLWIPLALADREGFRACVDEFAPGDSPLRPPLGL